MGARVDFTRHITISEKSWNNGFLKATGYQEVNDTLLQEIAITPKIQTVQINQVLPEEAYQKIDMILAQRPDMIFRVFNIIGTEHFDLSFLKGMTHLHHLRIDGHLAKCQGVMDFSILEQLHLVSLYLNCFDLRDYSFMQNLSGNLETLAVYTDTMGPSIKFDCKWLLQYQDLHTLWLGKKAKRNIAYLSRLSNLKSLSLRGIKVENFSFLKQMHLEKLALLWNSNDDLHELSELTELKEIELWRINRLSDISFIEQLKHLEVIKLQDLKHVTELPDLSNHSKLIKIFLIHTGINRELLPKEIQEKVSDWDDR